MYILKMKMKMLQAFLVNVLEDTSVFKPVNDRYHAKLCSIHL